ncbi:MAG: hypothetical protein L0154_22400 [Chloroflexi bacterium]|nr:hypothetical protein [Chloroflexota bacterium]
MPENLSDIYQIGNFIDTFALGHYARVLDAIHLPTGRTVAFKVMRPEHRAPDERPRWEAQAFVHEVTLLTRLEEHPVPMKFYDCGYVSTDSEYPHDGNIMSFGRDVQAFGDALYEANIDGWRPYIALEYLPREHNLLYVMKGSNGKRRRLPTEEGIDLAQQFGNLLAYAHERRIIYMDHKLEHLYWNGKTLRVIDWNSSKIVDNPTNIEQQRRKDLHNMCVGVLYPIFTGMSSQRGALRPQPGSLAEVNERYEDIGHLDFGSDPTLSTTIIQLLEGGAKEQYSTAYEFLKKLERAAHRFGWQTPTLTPVPMLVEARDKMRSGLTKLRMAEDLIRDARESFLSAAIMDGINEDMEEELRRLMKEVSDFLNERVIP